MECVEKGNFRHHDQDGLNKVFYHNWQVLPLRWNVIPPVFTLPVKVLRKSRWRNLALEALERPAVFHWAGKYKPWKLRHQKYSQKYYEYLDKTPFKEGALFSKNTQKKKDLFCFHEVHYKLIDFIKRICSSL